MKHSMRTVMFCWILGWAAAVSASAYSGGSGTEGSPFEISTVADWQQLMADSANWNKSFILMADIDLAEVAVTPVAPDTEPASWEFQGTPFSGVFNGNGHIVSNAVINQPDSYHIGLFGCVGTGGQIKNLGIMNAQITGYQNVGGLAGLNDEGTITSCYAMGTICGTTIVGGLVGENMDGTITSCYATGTVTGTYCVGGLAGVNYYGSTITFCYATGSVIATINYVGGLVDSNGGIIVSSFWDIQTSGQMGNTGGKGLTTIQMKTLSIFQNASWGDYGWVMADGAYPRLAWEGTGYDPIPPASPVPLTGTGTEAAPYQISTAADFALLSWYISVLDKHLILTTDIDLAGVMLYPIGDLGPFTGTFDGSGHILHHAVINQPDCDYVGLFGYLGSGSQIRNLGVVNAQIIGHCKVGGLMGYNEDGIITSCYTTGTVSGVEDVGGLVGENFFGTITNCYATGAISANDTVGGLVGRNGYYHGNCDGTGTWGRGTIISCYATGAVCGIYSYVGGLVGVNYMDSTIRSCYATGVVSGSSWVGGLAGGNGSSGAITSCYATGAASGDDGVGGLIGINIKGKAIRCYATGKPTGTSNIGGLCGEVMTGGGYEDTGNFWDIETSQTTYSAMGTGKTTAQMQTQSTFTTAGWDFRYVWYLPALDYPKLWPYCWLGGSGTPQDPYRITSLADFDGFVRSPRYWDDYIRLDTDIDLTGRTYTTALIAPDMDQTQWGQQGEVFSGVFDGDNHVINNLSIAASVQENVGLFGLIGAGGQVKNLRMENVDVTGRWNIGGLAGVNECGTITSCYATGVVHGTEGSTGGLVGANDGGTIELCFTSSTVEGTADYVGGLVGANGHWVSFGSGAIISCYSTGAVSGDNYIGGLTGWNEQAMVIDSYSTGKPTGTSDVGGLCGYVITGGDYIDTGNYWDLQTSETTISAMGIGKTTAQMKVRSTFTGWDFVNQWAICEAMNYPRLQWQIPASDWQCPEGVSTEDLAFFSEQWLSTGCAAGNNYCDGVDLNQSGTVDMADFCILAAHWLEGI